MDISKNHINRKLLSTRAKLIAKTTKIRTAEAYEILARLYGYSKWNDFLKSGLNSRIDYPYLNSTPPDLNERLIAWYNSHTVSSRLLPEVKEQSNLLKLLKNCEFERMLHEELDYLTRLIWAEKDFNSQNPHFDNLIMCFDNSIETPLRYRERVYSGHDHGDIYDYRLGLRYYYKLIEGRGRLKIVISELDSIAELDHAPGAGYSTVLQRPWFKNYIVGYILNLKQILQSAGIKGELIIENVYNRNLFRTSKNDPTNVIMSITNQLFGHGARLLQLHEDSSSTMGQNVGIGFELD